MITKLRLLIVKYNPFTKKKFSGQDLAGNMYFEDSSDVGKPKRTIYYVDGRNHISQYKPDDIPVEWQSWLRYTRLDAPQREELLSNQESLLSIQEKVRKLKEKDQKSISDS